MNHVLAIDSRSPSGRLIATSRFSRGFINWAVTTGDWAAWVDQSSEQSDAAPAVEWRLWVRKLTGGQTVLLDESRSATPFVPRPHAGDGYVAWATAESDRSAHQKIWMVGASEPRTLMRHAQVNPSLESVDADTLVYVGPAADTATNSGGDCWGVPTAGGNPQPLTHNGLVLDCQAGAGQLVWFQHIDPTVTTMPPDGVLENPWEIWSAPLASHAKPTLVHRGYIEGASPAVGTHFVAWLGEADASPLSIYRDGAESTLPAASSSRFLTAAGSWLAYLDNGEDGHSPVTIHLLKP